MENRAGTTRANGSGKGRYHSFCPSPLPPNPSIELDAEMIHLLIQANAALASLNTLSRHTALIDVYEKALLKKEIMISCNMEGQAIRYDDLLDPYVDQSDDRHVLIADALVKTMDEAFHLEALSINVDCIRSLHQKTFGTDEFRDKQNWIGTSTLRKADYIPPIVSDMQEAMEQLDVYLKEHVEFDPLMQIALIHYQYESILPFAKGNSEIGRMLIPLNMKEKGILEYACLPICAYFKEHQDEYYESMKTVRETGDYEQWIKFFLKGCQDSALKAMDTLDKLTALYYADLEKVKEGNKNVRKVYQFIAERFIVDVNLTYRTLHISFNTAATSIQKLMELGLVVQSNEQARNRLFAYAPGLAILKGE